MQNMNMINNLFSIFDPSTSFISIFWITLIIPILLLNNAVEIINSNNITLISVAQTAINNEVEQLVSSSNTNAFENIIISIFFTVLTLNLVAILPFNFCVTAHITITLCLSASIWMGLIINGVANSTSHIIIHLTPLGTPMPLINFIVVIELVSQIIRPITLAVRLMANIVAGHLLMNLLSNLSISSTNITIVNTATIMVLITLESAVAIIQAYVITLLLALYYKETF